VRAPFVPVFALDLPHGRCVGVGLPEAGRDGGGGGADAGDDGDAIPASVLSALPAAERGHVAGLPPGRRASWVGGRIALRAALADLGCAAGPILTTPRGAPLLPGAVRGSISHKRTLAVGIAARASHAVGPGDPGGAGLGSAWHLGVDLERVIPGRSAIARYVLRPEERARLPARDDPRRAEEVLFAFSAKEAIYKALDPLVQRYVSFREVAVERQADGAAVATLFLRDVTSDSTAAPPFEVSLRWLRHEDFILTTARVARAR
jgi:enterobactin synthetase component D